MNKFLQKVDIKITKFRKKLNEKYLTLFMYAVFVMVTFSLMYSLKLFKTNKQLAQNSYNRAMFETTEYLKNVEVLLTKLNVTSTPSQSAKTLAEVWKQSNLAKSNLVELPTTQKTIENASRYLAQLSDFSYFLMKKNLNGGKISEEEYKQMEKMQEIAVGVRQDMGKIVEKMEQGKLKWNETERLLAKNKKQKKAKEVSSLGIESIGKAFQDYEGLIYDGAFSSHITSLEPKMLTGKNVSAIEAENKVKKVIPEEYKHIKYIGESKGAIETYSFEAKKDKKDKKDKKEAGKINIEITKKDGKLLWYIADKKAGENKMSEEEAIKKGKEYLESLGVTNMKDSYFTIMDNMITINYAAMQDDVILYPDLIKLKISLEDGQICSAELHGYIYNHTKRDIKKPKKTMEEAKKVINNNVEIKNSRLAIIPTEGKGEILTYEFSGTVKEKNFLIYINANTLVEEKILLIIDSEKGTLTM